MTATRGQVADGDLIIEETFQNIIMSDDDPSPAGVACTYRQAFLNGAPVLDPALAQRLYDELQRRDDHGR